MGFLRGAGLVLVSIALFGMLLIGGIFLTLSSSLNYDKVQPAVYTLVKGIIETQIGEEQIKNEIMPAAEIYCQTEEEIIQDFGGYVLTIPCSIVKQGYDKVLDYSINSITHDFYYKEYNCKFIKCFNSSQDNSELPLFLISNLAHTFWRGLFLKFLLFSILLFGLIILLVKKKPNSLVLLGSLLIPISLVIFILSKVGQWVSSSASGGDLSLVLFQVIGIFFSQASRISLWMAISGGILIVLGTILKIFYKSSEEKASQEKVQEKPKEKKSAGNNISKSIKKKKK